MKNISLKTAALVLSTLFTVMQVSAADTGFTQNADLSIAQLQEEAYIIDCVLGDNLIISSTFGADDEMIAEESSTVDFVAEENLLANYMYGSINSEDLAEIDDNFLAMN